MGATSLPEGVTVFGPALKTALYAKGEITALIPMVTDGNRRGVRGDETLRGGAVFAPRTSQIREAPFRSILPVKRHPRMVWRRTLVQGVSGV
jgi:hypothetical protein